MAFDSEVTRIREIIIIYNFVACNVYLQQKYHVWLLLRQCMCVTCKTYNVVHGFHPRSNTLASNQCLTLPFQSPQLLSANELRLLENWSNSSAIKREAIIFISFKNESAWCGYESGLWINAGWLMNQPGPITTTAMQANYRHLFPCSHFFR